MKNILTLATSLALLGNSVLIATDCLTKQNPIHTHDTTNVGHQFYDALVETPKDALVKGGHASAELARATAELVVETPLKTLSALKNGTLKALIATKNGIIKGYQIMIKKPLIIAKEATVEMGHRIKSAGHTLAHGDDHEEHEHFEPSVATFDEIYVLVIEETRPASVDPKDQSKQEATKARNTNYKVMVVSPELVQSVVLKEECELMPVNQPDNTEHPAGINLSENTLLLLSQSFHCIATDLLHL